MTYRLLYDNEKDILEQISAFIRRAAAGERAFAKQVYHGKKIETDKREYAAKCLEQLARDISESMKLVLKSEAS